MNHAEHDVTPDLLKGEAQRWNKKMKRTAVASVAILFVCVAVICGYALGKRNATVTDQSFMVAANVGLLALVTTGDTDRAIQRMDDLVDMITLEAISHRSKFWLLPETRSNLDKTLLKVAEYREQNPRKVTDPLYFLIYPLGTQVAYDGQQARLLQMSSNFWHTVEAIRNK
jgi:hypothetical protein